MRTVRSTIGAQREHPTSIAEEKVSKTDGDGFLEYLASETPGDITISPKSDQEPARVVSLSRRNLEQPLQLVRTCPRTHRDYVENTQEYVLNLSYVDINFPRAH